MPALTDEFVALNRTFRELEFEPAARDDSELKLLFRRHGALHWADLLSEHRVILLSEAGSGKTEEIRSTAQRLRELGKPAFFYASSTSSTTWILPLKKATTKSFSPGQAPATKVGCFWTRWMKPA